jgi:ATP:cob(I)alamin adenosyltransferase
MNIYTGRGDDGMTDLRDLSRVAKTHVRIEAYGTVDEANAVIGTVYPSDHEDIDAWLIEVQNHLHIIQAEFATPDESMVDPQIDASHVRWLETAIDEFDAEVPPLTSFILPGGTPTAGDLHHARTVVRRAERRAVALAAAEPVDDQAITYLNRLSDALFILARVVNHRAGVEERTPSY